MEINTFSFQYVAFRHEHKRNYISYKNHTNPLLF